MNFESSIWKVVHGFVKDGITLVFAYHLNITWMCTFKLFLCASTIKHPECFCLFGFFLNYVQRMSYNLSNLIFKCLTAIVFFRLKHDDKILEIFLNLKMWLTRFKTKYSGFFYSHIFTISIIWRGVGSILK